MKKKKIDFIPGFFMHIFMISLQYIMSAKQFVAEKRESSTFFRGEGGRRMALTFNVSMNN